MGMLEELPSDHAAAIRGLFELAAFVADHPELPAPDVRAVFFPAHDPYADAAAKYTVRRNLVDQVAAAVGVETCTTASGTQYTATKMMGPVEVTAHAITPDSMAAYRAALSYEGNVQTEQRRIVDAAAAGGAR
ncbi:hypothetical protein [Kribbella sindirgiensis]|uniref:Uncharacterized protein n=1 Tax=Kribbella sindirgiensis TaxID=1124744 RepID=A0A4V2M496_9ACTN|nr:hypothetical protein [Kribbella sindirgiensis]TCC35102.1 hypothetical protein E0H50_14645 [Kribbella sindirgiensis]